MGRRANEHARCDRCRLHVEACICAMIAEQPVTTRVVLVMHRREESKPTNTGRIATLMLAGAELHVRGHQDAPLDLSALADPARRAWVLFPGEGARELSRAIVDEDPRPVTLVVPDGNWNQARSAVRREPALADLPTVTLPPGPETRYRLRREHVPGGLATAEAIARALGIIEGPKVQAEIEAVFEALVERMLAARG